MVKSTCRVMFQSRISYERRNTAVQIVAKDSTPCMAWRFVTDVVLKEAM